MAKFPEKWSSFGAKTTIYQYLTIFLSCTSCLNSRADLSLSQVTPEATPPLIPQEVIQAHPVRTLPGKLDSIPTFNSNSPEVVQSEGILVSTLPSTGKNTPKAHLNFPLRGRFDVFAHHIAKGTSPLDLRTLYLGIIVHNPNRQALKIKVLQAASYLSQPDAPFIELPPYTDNAQGTVYAGPGDRVMNDVLRGLREAEFPSQVVIPPQGYAMLLNHPIPTKTFIPPLNGRSTLMRLRTNRQVYVASLAMFAKSNPDGSDRPPTLAEWQELLKSGNLVTPRDLAPTPPDEKGKIIYGRVAGVAAGSVWKGKLVDPNSQYLSIPKPDGAYSYPIATVPGGTLGTSQIQSAPMLVRYPDTAYRAHGNYGIEYSLSLPLKNTTQQEQKVTIALQTPIKADLISQGLRFLEPPAKQTWFRGTVRLQYQDDSGLVQDKYIHLVQKRGQSGQPLVSLKMPKGDSRLIKINFLYPPDATPPQVLTIKTEP
ncbi:DUF3370 domain-containing protein [Merismopedia glauca]|uniref:DUF3370 domain-containing protein n=1 Tax=Merismopedia glauca CCAP 1448/3 TaxID=1296344 RepID=A0A2T1C8Y5_9CYAN|nr:DUF3370 domain-containing protein [Merismopedia glauca]PSB04730.1 hypothetical protein C7B64_02605 [Merismopedia glauca CCAP 1448/3]